MYAELAKRILERFFPGKKEGEDTGVIPESGHSILGNISAGKGTILIVDDNEMIRRFARDVFEAGGYTVFEATNGRDAIAICEHSGESIDLLLTDVIMPVMGGLLLAENVEKRFPNIAILFMSGFSTDATLHDSVGKSTVNFIQKPFSPEALELKVNEIFDARTSVRAL